MRDRKQKTLGDGFLFYLTQAVNKLSFIKYGRFYESGKGFKGNIKQDRWKGV